MFKWATFKWPDDGRSISRNVAHLNILVHDVINLLYYEYWTDKQKYLYVFQNFALIYAFFQILSVKYDNYDYRNMGL